MGTAHLHDCRVDAVRYAIQVHRSDDRAVYSWSTEDPPLHARYRLEWLHSATQRVAAVHTFGKGMGIAAPQVGIERAAAIVRPPNNSDVLTLLNPRIIESSDETDEQYEGSLSFCDVHGILCRDHLPSSGQPIPVEQYRGTGTSWEYHDLPRGEAAVPGRARRDP